MASVLNILYPAFTCPDPCQHESRDGFHRCIPGLGTGIIAANRLSWLYCRTSPCSQLSVMVRSQDETVPNLMMFTTAFIPEEYDSKEGDAASHTFLLELSALLFDFGFRLHLLRSPSQEPGARLFPSQALYELDDYNNTPTTLVLKLCSTQLEGAARQQGEYRRVAKGLLLQQGLLLRCLRGARLLQPKHARTMILLATAMIAPAGLLDAAADGGQLGEVNGLDQVLAVQVGCSGLVSCTLRKEFWSTLTATSFCL
jgi:hypothetical protein